MFSIFDIVLILAAAAIAFYFFNGFKIREIAIEHAKRHCDSLDVQLLDQSVALKKINISKTKAHSLRLQRSYTFEFTSTGDDRYAGNIVMLGRFMDTIHLDPHRITEHQLH